MSRKPPMSMRISKRNCCPEQKAREISSWRPRCRNPRSMISSRSLGGHAARPRRGSGGRDGASTGTAALLPVRSPADRPPANRPSGRIDGHVAQNLGAGCHQLATRLDLVRIWLGILHQRGRHSYVPQQEVCSAVRPMSEASIANDFQQLLRFRVAHVVCGFLCRASAATRPVAALQRGCAIRAAKPGSPASVR